MRKKANSASSAREQLSTEGTSPRALLKALHLTLGPDVVAWEPETVWVSLQRVGIDVPEGNRDAILAALSLLEIPSFFWDAAVFEKTAVAFAGRTINPSIVEEAPAEDLAWGVRTAAAIRQDAGESNQPFEHEPRAYAACVLHRAGYVLAPPELEFAQDILNSLNAGDSKELRNSVESSLKDPPEELKETALDVQLARLLAIKSHVEDRSREEALCLASLA